MELRAENYFSSMEEAHFKIKKFVSKISINISYRIPNKKISRRNLLSYLLTSRLIFGHFSICTSTSIVSISFLFLSTKRRCGVIYRSEITKMLEFFVYLQFFSLNILNRFTNWNFIFLLSKAVNFEFCN